MPTISIKLPKYLHEGIQRRAYRILEKGIHEDLNSVYWDAMVKGLERLDDCAPFKRPSGEDEREARATHGYKEAVKKVEDPLEVMKEAVQGQSAGYTDVVLGRLQGDFAKETKPLRGGIVIETVDSPAVETPASSSFEDKREDNLADNFEDKREDNFEDKREDNFEDKRFIGYAAAPSVELPNGEHEVTVELAPGGLEMIQAYLRKLGLETIPVNSAGFTRQSITDSESSFKNYIRTLRDEAEYPMPEPEYDDEGKQIPLVPGAKFARPSVFPRHYVLDSEAPGGVRELPYEMRDGDLPPDPSWYLVLRQDIPEHERKRHDYYASFGMRRWHSHYMVQKEERVDVLYWSPDPRNWADTNDNPVKPFPQLQDVIVGYATKDDAELDLSSSMEDHTEPARKYAFFVVRADNPDITPANAKTVRVRRRTAARRQVVQTDFDPLGASINNWNSGGMFAQVKLDD